MKRLILLYLAVLFIWSCAFTVVAGNQFAYNSLQSMRTYFSLSREVRHREEMFRYEDSKRYQDYLLDVLNYKLVLLEQYGY